MRWPRNLASEAAKRREKRLGSTEPELERKYGIALALYVALAVLAWFTIGAGRVDVFGKQFDIRLVPIFILATFAFRTVIAMKAERIRRGK
jgi:hypothetical protein